MQLLKMINHLLNLRIKIMQLVKMILMLSVKQPMIYVNKFLMVLLIKYQKNKSLK